MKRTPSWVYLGSMLFIVACGPQDTGEAPIGTDPPGTAGSGGTSPPRGGRGGNGGSASTPVGGSGSGGTAGSPAGTGGSASGGRGGSSPTAGTGGVPPVTPPATGGTMGTTTDGGAPPIPPPNGNPQATPGGVPESALVFDDNKVDTYTFTVAPADWQRLQSTAIQEMYVPAELEVSGQKVGKVGLRYKGNWGTLRPCFEGGATCAKVSLKVDIAEYEKDKKWNGVKKLNLHSMLRDPSLLHERLAYKVWREMGVHTCRSTHAKVVVNGVYKGVYALTEALDGRFTADRWPKFGDGNLYKEAWPTAVDSGYYAMRLKTNEDKMPPVMHTKFIQFAQELTKAPTPADGAKVLDKWSSVDYLMRALAVDRAVGNWDGPITFYCSTSGSTWCGNHNFYWYQAENEDKFWLIPWDHDNTGTVGTMFDQVPPWDKTPANCTERVMVGLNRIMPPGCDPLYKALASQKQAYQAAVTKLLDIWNVQRLQADIDKWAAQIQPAIAMEMGTQGVEPWKVSVKGFKYEVAVIRDRLEALAAGREPATTPLRTDALNDFEGARLGIMQASHWQSLYGLAPSVNTAEPLAGKQDVRIDVGGAGIKGQWGWFKFNLDKPVVSLTGVKAVKMRIRADRARYVRVDIDSLKYKNYWSGVRYGWDVNATPTGTVITLDTAMMKIPTWGAPQGDVLADILNNASGVIFSGLVKNGMQDVGWVQIDDIEFVK